VRSAYEVDHNNLSGKEVEDLVKDLLVKKAVEEGKSGGASAVRMPCQKTMKNLAADINANPNIKGMDIVDLPVLIASNITSIYSSKQTCS
jgi:hypothetical protein